MHSSVRNTLYMALSNLNLVQAAVLCFENVLDKCPPFFFFFCFQIGGWAAVEVNFVEKIFTVGENIIQLKDIKFPYNTVMRSVWYMYCTVYSNF